MREKKKAGFSIWPGRKFCYIPILYHAGTPHPHKFRKTPRLDERFSSCRSLFVFRVDPFRPTAGTADLRLFCLRTSFSGRAVASPLQPCVATPPHHARAPRMCGLKGVSLLVEWGDNNSAGIMKNVFQRGFRRWSRVMYCDAASHL